MSLNYYQEKFQNLNMHKLGGTKSPHKVAMLLASMHLIQNGSIKDNKIPFSDELLETFTEYFNELKAKGNVDNPHLPYYHLQTDGFWHLRIKPGMLNEFSKLSSFSGKSQVLKFIEYAYLDDALFELLLVDVVHEYLSKALHSNLEFDQQTQNELLDVGKGWNWLECEKTVQSYFDMLSHELTNEPYSKAEYRRELKRQLNDVRSEGSIEFKHQNISAILVEMGMPYISGYKPRYNYQEQLMSAIFAHLAANSEAFKKFTTIPEIIKSPYDFSFDSVLDEEIPELSKPKEKSKRSFKPKKVNYAEKESRNRKLGQRAEEFVIEYERHRLIQIGKEDLADEVHWASKDDGDGLGYDIRSFSVTSEGSFEELYIEVKATNSGKYTAFYVSKNELDFSEIEHEKYALYRVYDFKSNPRIFVLSGDIKQHVNLYPTNYIASF